MNRLGRPPLREPRVAISTNTRVVRMTAPVSITIAPDTTIPTSTGLSVKTRLAFTVVPISMRMRGIRPSPIMTPRDLLLVCQPLRVNLLSRYLVAALTMAGSGIQILKIPEVVPGDRKSQYRVRASHQQVGILKGTGT